MPITTCRVLDLCSWLVRSQAKTAEPCSRYSGFYSPKQSGSFSPTSGVSQDFIMERVEHAVRCGFGRGAASPLPSLPARNLGSALSSPSEVRLSYIVRALDGVSYCILGAPPPQPHQPPCM